MSTANWPIKVGGIYPALGSSMGGRYRVIAIEGDAIFYVYGWTDGEESPKGPQSMDASIFRISASPEDQSPIPELVEAIENALNYRGMDEFLGDTGIHENMVWGMRKEGLLKLRAALAKAGAR